MDQVCNMHVEDIFLKLLWWTENIGVFIVPMAIADVPAGVFGILGMKLVIGMSFLGRLK